MGRKAQLRELFPAQFLETAPLYFQELDEVTALIISGFGAPRLPAVVTELSSLKTLVLSSCHALEQLPPELGQLASLECISIGQCPELKEIPQEVSQLTKVKEFSLSDPNGELLSSCNDQLSSIEKLKIWGCNAVMCRKVIPNAIPKLCNLQSLALLDLEAKMMPADLSCLACLQELELSGRHLSPILQSVCKLTSLTKLSLAFCEVLETLPREIAQLQNLRELRIIGCTKFARLTEDIGRLKRLELLGIRGCECMGELPLSTFTLERLKHLSLSNMQWNSIPAGLGQLSSLTDLAIERCEDLRELPPEVGLLQNLTTFKVRRCSCLSAFPPGIVRWSQLKNLWLGPCDEFPLLLCKLLSLQELHIEDFGAEGLPEDIGQLKNLEYLSLHRCLRLSQLPGAIGNLTALQQFGLYKCSRLRVIPTSIRKLQRLKYVSMKHSALDALPVFADNVQELTCSKWPYDFEQLVSATFPSLLRILDMKDSDATTRRRSKTANKKVLMELLQKNHFLYVVHGFDEELLDCEEVQHLLDRNRYIPILKGRHPTLDTGLWPLVLSRICRKLCRSPRRCATLLFEAIRSPALMCSQMES